MHRLGAVGARDGLVALLDALQREGEPPALAVDLEDAHVHRVALRDDLARVLDVVRRELGDVHEALDAREDLDEGAERDDLRHAPSTTSSSRYDLEPPAATGPSASA